MENIFSLFIYPIYSGFRWSRLSTTARFLLLYVIRSLYVPFFCVIFFAISICLNLPSTLLAVFPSLCYHWAVSRVLNFLNLISSWYVQNFQLFSFSCSSYVVHIHLKFSFFQMRYLLFFLHSSVQPYHIKTFPNLWEIRLVFITA